MSLINDALKRAKEVQEQVPPPATAGPQFRPAEPEPYARHGIGLMVPVAFALVALLTLLLVWGIHRSMSTGTQELAVAELQAKAPPVSAAPDRSAPLAPPTSAVPAVEPAPRAVAQPAGVTGPATAPVQAGSPPASQVTTTVVAKSQAAAGVAAPQPPTATVAPDPPAVPKAPPPRLQGIIFNSRNSSALINGKTLFIGEYLGDLRLIAIGKNTATLAGGGQSHVLTLEP